MDNTTNHNAKTGSDYPLVELLLDVVFIVATFNQLDTGIALIVNAGVFSLGAILHRIRLAVEAK